LAILATAGTGIVSVVATALSAAEDAERREARFEAATAVLTRLTFQDRHGLDIRLGTRVEGSVMTRVDRPRQGLYRLAVSDTTVPGDELVVTIVHRAEEP
jgi:hypothetical protein